MSSYKAPLDDIRFALYDVLDSDALFAKLDAIGWSGPRPGGSFFVWLPVPEGYTSQASPITCLTKHMSP